MIFSSIYLSIASVIKTLLSFVGVYAIIFKFWPRHLILSIGSFWIFNYKYKAPEVTNYVSQKFYAGGNVPDYTRYEIIQQTMPLIWGFRNAYTPILRQRIKVALWYCKTNNYSSMFVTFLHILKIIPTHLKVLLKDIFSSIFALFIKDRDIYGTKALKNGIQILKVLHFDKKYGEIPQITTTIIDSFLAKRIRLSMDKLPQNSKEISDMVEKITGNSRRLKDYFSGKEDLEVENLRNEDEDIRWKVELQNMVELKEAIFNFHSFQKDRESASKEIIRKLQQMLEFYDPEPYNPLSKKKHKMPTVSATANQESSKKISDIDTFIQE